MAKKNGLEPTAGARVSAAKADNESDATRPAPKPDAETCEMPAAKTTKTTLTTSIVSDAR